MNHVGASRTAAPSLVRGLTLVGATAVVIANVIGTGVFIKARVMICNVGSPEMVLVAWAAGGLLSLAGALTYAELGAMMPYSGGEYPYLGAAYGRRWAFLYGWMGTLIDKGGGNAALAIGCVIFLNDILGDALDATTIRFLPVAVLALATALNLASVRASGRIATILTIMKVALVLGVGIGAFLLADGSAANYAGNGAGGTCEDVPSSARAGIAGFSAAVIAALWGYQGWNAICQVGGEIVEPHRNIPRALIGGTLIIMALYVFVNASYFWVLAPENVASISTSSSVAFESARRFLGPAALGLMAAGLMISTFGALHTNVLAGSRVTYAVASDGLFPRLLGSVHSGTRVPAASVLFHGAWASILAVTGSFDSLTNFAIFGSWIFYGLAGAAVFVLRWKRPDAERPYRTWGYPYVPLLFLVLTIFLLATTIVAMPIEAVAGIGLILLGLPVYAFYSRRAGTHGQ